MNDTALEQAAKYGLSVAQRDFAIRREFPNNVKQVIIVRKDLGMNKGKLMSQAAHASMKVFVDRLEYKETINNGNTPVYRLETTCNMSEWLDGVFTKVVLAVKSEEEMVTLTQKAREAGIPCAEIIDNGTTAFNGVPTLTTAAIGPDLSSKIDAITGHLPLY